MPLNKLLKLLKNQNTSPTVFNQYESSHRLSNLKAYLEYCKEKKQKILLVGEAPGYAGCAITGIPFTSEKVLNRMDLDYFNGLRSNLRNIQGDTTERSATIVWNTIKEIHVVPAFWNSFPFHPHEKNSLRTNRTPNEDEILIGRKYLELVIDYLNPKVVAGLGKLGFNTLQKIFPEGGIMYIRHPSYGGKPEFIKGINKIVRY